MEVLLEEVAMAQEEAAVAGAVGAVKVKVMVIVVVQVTVTVVAPIVKRETSVTGVVVSPAMVKRATVSVPTKTLTGIRSNLNRTRIL